MDIIFSFEKDTERFLRSFSVPLEGKSFLVGLSGGADSVALTKVLCSLGKRLGFAVFALHVNHGIRGDEALRDEEFCISFCRSLGITLKVVRADIPAMAAEKKQSLELCGREYRYSVFSAYAKEKGIDYIATAHNANDNAETVLYNLLRGSGAEGLCGIPKVRDNILRPILCMSRERIEGYVDALGTGYVTDGTNADNSYTRNYIRNVLLPACKHVNEDAVSAINRAASAIEEDCTLVAELADAYLSGGAGDLCGKPRPVRVRVIKAMYARFSDRVLEKVHVDAVDSALFAKGQKRISLPDGITAVVYGGSLSFKKRDAVEGCVAEKTPILLGDTSYAGGLVTVTLGQEKKGQNAYIRKNSIKGDLFARPREAGDRLRIRGMSRSVKKILTDNKIPPSIRQIMPIICDDEGIIYVPYIGVADRACTVKGEETLGISVSIDERVGFLDNEKF